MFLRSHHSSSISCWQQSRCHHLDQPKSSGAHSARRQRGPRLAATARSNSHKMFFTPSIGHPMHLMASLLLQIFLLSGLLLLSSFPQVPIAQAFLMQQVGPNSPLPQPSFIKNMDLSTVKENTPVGEIVYTLEAQVESFALSTSQLAPVTKIMYAIDGTHLFSVDKKSGQVRVAQAIDREQTSDQVTFQVSATAFYNVNGQQRPQLVTGPTTQLTITVFILDENDNPPKIERVRVGRSEFDTNQLARQMFGPLISGSNLLGGAPQRNPTIRLNVSESLPVDAVIVDLIEAIDVDKASPTPLQSTCLGCEPEFALRSTSDSLLNDRLNSTLVLVQPLVHVPRNNIRQLHVVVNDGKFNTTISFEITIDDVQNKPPQFVGSSTCIVQENVAIDTTIMTLQALDGDVVDDSMAAATVSGSNGNSLPKSGGGATIASLGGRQILYDLSSSVDQIEGGNLFGSTNKDFKLHPLTGQLQVANRLDRESYLNVNGVISLKVRARELTVNAETIVRQDNLYDSILEKLAPYTDPSADAVSELELTIILVDVNDNEPHWLNGSEIMALNMNQSPDWFASLPNDRDTGRIYQLMVKENSLAGTPLTTRNELFVYDLDNGQNASFNLTLEDPFKLFEVEPKQVSGFALVTLRLANAAGSLRRSTSSSLASTAAPSATQLPRLFDYENPNERSYIIQVIATETNTRERFSSKAQIQINVLDVNDNAPEFKESAYHANIREDAPAGKPVLLVQATDKDEISNHLVYSLHGRSAYLFDINRQSGLITVAKCNPQGSAGYGGQPSTPPQTSASSRSRHRESSSQQQQQQSRQCIDYELQKSHHLMVEVSDGELSSKVPLTVFIDDVSDNPPVFALPVLDVVIEEGNERLEPPIRIEATDADQSSVLSYSIVEGNFEGLFAINNATGELQLTRPIRISHEESSSTGDIGDYRHQQLNKMTLVIQATDGLFTANGTIRIDVLDSNDNAPKFVRSQYSAEIHESMSPGQLVTTVLAVDLDRGNNARVSYRLQRGSYGQFEIDESSGAITIARDAPELDARKREKYTLEVVAYDHGLVSRSSSVLVHIHVLDFIKKAPEFEPQIQRTTVPETTLNTTIIHRMSVAGGSASQQLVFKPGPIEALDKNGRPVPEGERLESMFKVSTGSGEVMVSSGLDHDFASYINLTIYVSNSAAPPTTSSANGSSMSLAPESSEEESQSPASGYIPYSVGYLIINIVDDNTNAPVFTAPWSVQQPELSFQMLEELPVGSILTQLVASDVDSKISHFKIEPANEYFELTSPQSGTIVNRKLIDYDTLMSQTFLTPGSYHRASSASSSAAAAAGSSSNFSSTTGSNAGNNIIQFNVYVYDSGLPQLSAKALVSVEILPANDWDCKFEQSLYEVRLKENTPPDTLLVQVRANDLDYGEQHNSIRYQLLGDHSDYFTIDPKTGWLRVSQRGSVSLDRERLSQTSFPITVIGRDEHQQQQGGAIEQQQQSAGLRLQPTASRGGSQHQLLAPTTTTGRTCSTTIKVHVDDVNDNPPLFLQKVFEVITYDTDAVDVPIIKLLVRDEDSAASHNSIPANTTTANNRHSLPPSTINSFKIVSGNINDSFNITNSGLIYATKPLNESMVPSNGGPIQLRVQVKQQSVSSVSGVTSFADECVVRVYLVKINRWGPEWRFNPAEVIAVKENSRPGTLVTQLKCVDRDYETTRSGGGKRIIEALDESITSVTSPRRTNGGPVAQGNPISSNPIRYWIKENGVNVMETREFKLDPVSGNLVTRVELDRELKEFYELVVTCVDNGRPQSLESVTPLVVTVLDMDDNKPEFVIPKEGVLSTVLKPLVSQPSPSLSRAAAQKTSVRPPTISFSVEEHQIKGLPVGEIKAIDKDLEALVPSPFPTNYCLIDGNEFQEFSLDRITGILYTNQSLDREKQSSYDLLVKAINDGSGCELDKQEDSSSLPNSLQNSTTKQQPTTTTTGPQQQAIFDQADREKQQRHSAAANDRSLLLIKVEVLDINDNAPTYRKPVYRAGVHHRSLMNTLVTQVAAFDPDSGLNGTLSYKISEILMYKTAPSQQSQQQSQPSLRSRYEVNSNEQHHQPLSKPIKLIQNPFRIDQHGNVYTQQLLTQYQLMSMFVLQLEASEQAEPWRTARTRLEIYVYETGSQLKIRINLHPRLVETYRPEIESLLSNSTKYTAIINRARSYNGAFSLETGKQAAAGNSQATSSVTVNGHNTNNRAVDSSVPKSTPSAAVATNSDSESSSFSNIHLIFVDDFRIVNPHLVMERFDLTSAQLFMPQTLTQSPPNQPAADGQQQQQRLQFNEVSSLIDKIALASVQSAELHAGSSSATSLAGIDWLESPSVLFVTLTIVLVMMGFIICLFGCCCTSRIKDHIIKAAMDKLVQQQQLQAKINEQMLAATNQAATLNGGAASRAGTMAAAQQEYMLQQQNGGFMSSFDVTKSCITNNKDNMGILQRAMESGEFIDPNYTTLKGHINMGAHYYDASELEQQSAANGGGMSSGGGGGHEMNGTTTMNGDDGSFELGDAIEEYDVGDDDLTTGQQAFKTKPNGNGNLPSHNSTSDHPRQRQLVPHHH